MLKEETDLNRSRHSSMKKRARLRVPAGDFNVLVLRKKVVRDVVDGYTLDGNKKTFEAMLIGADEIDDVFGSGWNRRGVVNGGKLRQARGRKNVDVVSTMVVAIRHRAVIPAVGVVRG